MKEYSLAEVYFLGNHAEVEPYTCLVPLLHISAKSMKVFGEEILISEMFFRHSMLE